MLENVVVEQKKRESVELNFFFILKAKLSEYSHKVYIYDIIITTRSIRIKKKET